jgi:hypothetical protein
VIVNVAVPTKLTKEQRELFEKLAESLGTTVKPQEKGFLDWLNDALWAEVGTGESSFDGSLFLCYNHEYLSNYSYIYPQYDT